MPRRNLPPRVKETRNRRWIAGSALLAAGATGGGIVAGSLTAGAASIPAATSSGSSSASTPANAPPKGDADHRAGGAPFGLKQSGTVTVVGTKSVTIRTSTATATYAIVASSDIDKNGEAALSALVVGDKVTFDTVKSVATPTIAHLHAGTESLNRPAHDGPRPGGDGRPGGSTPGGPPPEAPPSAA